MSKYNAKVLEKFDKLRQRQLDPENLPAETQTNSFDDSSDDSSDDSREKLIGEFKRKIYQLETDNEELRKQLEHYKKLNARGAGRKPICSNEQIKDILAKHAEGISMSKIANELGCSTATISRVIKAHTSV